MNVKSQYVTSAILLALTMLATRFSHFGDAVSLPDASWVVFFAAGFLGLAWRSLAGLMVLAVGIDVWAVGLMNVSDYCLTPAYAWLQLAHLALFGLGRYAARRHSLLSAYAVGLGAIFLAYVISNGSFYWLGGRVAETNMVQFAEQFMRYLTPYMGYNALYLSLSAAVLLLARRIQKAAPQQAQSV